MSLRPVVKVNRSKPLLEGAGVKIKRAFGYRDVQSLDPFLMLDDFHSDDPQDYMAGFPLHPHRGIETVTYMIRGEVEHRDSIGNHGVIRSGDVQWMTAGSGIMHEEMPWRTEGMMQGFQLWVNLPRAHKMMSPRYREIKKEDIPVVKPEMGVEVKVVAGEVDGVIGPVKDLVVKAQYLDVELAPNHVWEHSVPEGESAFVYVFQGKGSFDRTEEQFGPEHLVMFGEGDTFMAKSRQNGVRFLLASGRPLREPVAWGGPIVMNTEAELEQAFNELNHGTFIKMH
jgi:redox-sensitive bicupin YhaK (pirin superfamily)